MIRLIFVATVLVATTFSVQVFGQSSYLGLRVGYSSSTLRSDGESNTSIDPRQGMVSALVFCNLPLSNKFGYSIEPGYVLKGMSSGERGMNYSLHYVTIPVLAEYYPTQKFKISVGPEVSSLIKARQKVEDSNISTSPAKFEKFEISAALGANYSLSYFADFGMRYSVGMSRVAKFDAMLNRKNFYNNYLQVYLLFKIAN